MSFSGFLMYASAQKNRLISLPSYLLLSIYLILTSSSTTLSFLFVNLGLIYFLSMLLKRFNNQIIASTSILIYSIIIDLICFYAFPTPSQSLPIYIYQGIIFNLKSALPPIALASIINLAKPFIKIMPTKKLSLLSE